MVLGSLSEGTGGRKVERGKLTYQKQGYRSAQDEACDHIGAVVPVFRDPVEARQEGHAEGPEAQHWLGQSAALRLDCACDVHLEQDRDWGVTRRLLIQCTHMHAPTHANRGCAKATTSTR